MVIWIHTANTHLLYACDKPYHCEFINLDCIHTLKKNAIINETDRETDRQTLVEGGGVRGEKWADRQWGHGRDRIGRETGGGGGGETDRQRQRKQ